MGGRPSPIGGMASAGMSWHADTPIPRPRPTLPVTPTDRLDFPGIRNVHVGLCLARSSAGPGSMGGRQLCLCALLLLLVMQAQRAQGGRADAFIGASLDHAASRMVYAGPRQLDVASGKGNAGCSCSACRAAQFQGPDMIRCGCSPRHAQGTRRRALMTLPSAKTSWMLKPAPFM